MCLPPKQNAVLLDVCLSFVQIVNVETIQVMNFNQSERSIWPRDLLSTNQKQVFGTPRVLKGGFLIIDYMIIDGTSITSQEIFFLRKV